MGTAWEGKEEKACTTSQKCKEKEVKGEGGISHQGWEEGRREGEDLHPPLRHATHVLFLSRRGCKAGGKSLGEGK